MEYGICHKPTLLTELIVHLVWEEVRVITDHLKREEKEGEQKVTEVMFSRVHEFLDCPGSGFFKCRTRCRYEDIEIMIQLGFI